jgi:hypothetical protein
MMHWVLQENLFNEKQYLTVVETLERFGFPYSVHKVIPFVGELVPELKLDHKNVICIGSYSLRHCAKKYGWVPGVFDLFDQDFEKQRQHWGQYMLNYDSTVSRFGDAILPQQEMFVRPVNDSKHFSGHVFNKTEFEDWQRRVRDLHEDTGSGLTPDTLVQVAEATMIYSEYRFWIVKNEIVTKSMYKRGDRVIYSPEVDDRFTEFVSKRISEWSPHETFVIDVCDTSDGIKIIEINTLNSSGFYEADVQKLVVKLEEAYGTSR